MILRLHGLLLLLLILLPVIYTLGVSFSPRSLLVLSFDPPSLRWYQDFFSTPRYQWALLRSLVIALLSGFLSVLLATPAALTLARTRSHVVTEFVLLLPACLPAVAIGMGLLPMFHLTGLWGTITGIILIHTLLGIPIAYLIVRSNVTLQSDELTLAARGLGASRWQAWWRVTFPILRPTLIAAALAVGVLSLNESLVTVFVATPHSETLPAVIWPQLRYSATPIIAAAAIVTTVFSLVAVGVVCLYFRSQSRIGATHR